MKRETKVEQTTRNKETRKAFIAWFFGIVAYLTLTLAGFVLYE